MERQSTIGRINGMYDHLLRLIAYSGNCAYQVVKYNGRSRSYNAKMIAMAEADGFLVRIPMKNKVRASYRLTKTGYEYIASKLMENGISAPEIQRHYRLSRAQSNPTEYRRNLALSQIASLFQNIGAALYPDEEGYYMYQEESRQQQIIIKPQKYCFVRSEFLRTQDEIAADENATIGTRSQGVLITPKFNMEVYFFDRQQLRISRAAEERYHSRCIEYLACTGNPIYALYIFSDEETMRGFMEKTLTAYGYLNPYNGRCDRLYAHLLTQSAIDPAVFLSLIKSIEAQLSRERKAKEQQEAIGQIAPIPYHNMTALDIAYLNRLNTHYAESKHPIKIQTLSAYVELVDRFCREQIGSKLCVTVPDFFEDFEG